MRVVGRKASRKQVRRTVLAGLAAVAAITVLAPVGAAPGEQPGYRRLVGLESTRTYSDDLAAALTSGDVRIAGRAALALGRTQDPRAAGFLDNATSAQDVPVRALAVYGYGLLAVRVPVPIAPIARALRDPAGAVRVAAVDAAWRAKAAGRLGSVALLRPLLTLLRTDPEPIVRARAATALSGWREGPDGIGIADELQRDFHQEHDPSVRWVEAWTLRRAYAVTTAPATVRAGLRDRDELVRIQFADLEGRRRDRDGSAWLTPLLHDPSWRVAEQASESLRLLRGEPRTEHLVAIPDGIVTPSPAPENTEAPLPRPTGLGPPRAPVADDARLDLPLLPTTSAAMDGPMPGPHPRVRIGTTAGTIVVRLYPEWAPLTVANFLNLVDRGYYDGLRWFRIVPDLVVQTGDPTNTGDGDAGYTIPAEENPLPQRAGVISMGLDYTSGAHPAPKRDSAGTQFYITLSPQLHLDRDFTVFGRVESGFATLGRLIETDHMTRVERLPDD
jgi:cyclophilin family peptidyl-prolyl cis-trans isomerase/HEAT repeat protein